jgi:hypothetical protein
LLVPLASIIKAVQEEKKGASQSMKFKWAFIGESSEMLAI